MKRFVQGEGRSQGTLLPEVLDDYVTENNAVRVIDVFVDQLDLGKLGFEGVEPAATGRPAYHPSTLLKVYIYGYLNRLQSTRRLELETQRNVEMMWLGIGPMLEAMKAALRALSSIQLTRFTAHLIETLFLAPAKHRPAQRRLSWLTIGHKSHLPLQQC